MRTRFARARLWLLAVAITATAGCVSVDGLPSRADHGDGELVVAADTDVLWSRIESALEQEGYPLDSDLTEREHGRFVSTWFEELDPLRRRERRRRVSVLIEHGESDRWLVAVAVQRQRRRPVTPASENDASGSGTAAWMPDGLDEDAADLLLYKLELGLRRRD